MLNKIFNFRNIIITSVFILFFLSISHTLATEKEQNPVFQTKVNQNTESSVLSSDFIYLIVFIALNIIIILSAFILKTTSRKKIKKVQFNFQKVYNSSISETSKMYDDVELFGKSTDIHINILYNLILVIDELMLEIINKLYPGVQTNKITLRLDFDPQRVKADLLYTGDMFNPFDLPAFDISKAIHEDSTEGLGIFLVQNYIDKHIFAYAQDLNKLTIFISQKLKTNSETN